MNRFNLLRKHQAAGGPHHEIKGSSNPFRHLMRLWRECRFVEGRARPDRGGLSLRSFNSSAYQMRHEICGLQVKWHQAALDGWLRRLIIGGKV